MSLVLSLVWTHSISFIFYPHSRSSYAQKQRFSMKKHLLLLWASLSINLSAQALNPYDFQFGELFYDITSDSTVEVTYQGYFGSMPYDGLTTVSIPEIVTYEE